MFVLPQPFATINPPESANSAPNSKTEYTGSNMSVFIENCQRWRELPSYAEGMTGIARKSIV
jgi:hypothetical protein